MTTDRYKAQATRLIPAADGFRRVPAYVAAPPRQRGRLTEWLAAQRAGAEKHSA